MTNQTYMDAPFPGMRSFREQEAGIFFGRENAIEDILKKVHSNRFVAIAAPSGSGKSSLVLAGLLPALKHDSETAAGGFEYMIMRPGNTPFQNLSAAIISSAFLENNCPGTVETIEMHLRQYASPFSFFQNKTSSNALRLLIIDQFEEIFLNRQNNNDDESKAFVQYMLQLTHGPDDPVHVVITMRSDFIGECTKFYGLPEAMNSGQYLLGRMNRAQLQTAILQPVLFFSATIDEAFAALVLNEVTDKHDYLLLLQHALRRTWENALSERTGLNDAVNLTKKNYDKIGGIGKSLHLEADEVYSGLPAHLQPVAESMFKLLCEKTADGLVTRRFEYLYKIIEVAQVPREQVIEVVNAFRNKEHNFLTTSTQALNDNTVIEIRSEALLIYWYKIKTWADEERDLARIYRWLAEAIETEKPLLQGNDLNAATDWYKNKRLTKAWASRYGSEDKLDEIIAYISASSKAITTRRKPVGKKKIFISYRRSDSQDIVDRIQELLVKHFGKHAIFYDIDTIPYGSDFKKFINEKLDECNVLLAIIGNNWLDARLTDEPGSLRRLDDPSDFVRIEIETALKQSKPVIPVLVGRAAMPEQSKLPHTIRALSSFQYAEIFSGPEFRGKVNLLIKQIENITGLENKYFKWFL